MSKNAERRVAPLDYTAADEGEPGAFERAARIERAQAAKVGRSELCDGVATGGHGPQQPPPRNYRRDCDQPPSRAQNSCEFRDRGRNHSFSQNVKDIRGDGHSELIGGEGQGERVALPDGPAGWQGWHLGEHRSRGVDANSERGSAGAFGELAESLARSGTHVKQAVGGPRVGHVDGRVDRRSLEPELAVVAAAQSLPGARWDTSESC